jgi:hypothetical protein
VETGGREREKGGGKGGRLLTFTTPFLRSGRRPHPRHHHRVRGQEL